MKTPLQSVILSVAFVGSAFATGVGYDDTPVIPGQKWKVHDKARPNPAIVVPAENFSQNAGAPADATVLFDGKDLSHWKAGDGTEAKWKVEDGVMSASKGDITTKEKFGDFQLHIEWSAPTPPKGESQGRGNSGVFLHGLYEVQVLDVYQNKTYADGQAGGLYGQWPPLANAIKKPGEWNSYDIIFEGPKWDEAGNISRKASVTVIHNGVVLHHKKEYNGPTNHRSVTPYPKYDGTGPIRLQDHGDPVRYRNIWIRPLGEYDRPEAQ
ncbi:MAG TPA: DUF1080 domain-containing protein [Candidatus Limnocylindria bacterium]|jgi:hypothetical protein|nr:DUF1080 domain-containing protein [Candidatus Limnocylindria bacterium]